MSRYELPEESPSAPLTWSHAELDQLAIDGRPELQAAALGIKRATASRWLKQTRWLPELTARYEMRRFRDSATADEHDTFLGLTVPVWSLLQGASGEWKAADQDVGEAKAMYDQMKNEVLLAVHEAYAKAMSADHALTTYEQLTLPQAKQQVEVALAAYEAGRSDFLDLIDAQRMLKDIQLADYKARADYAVGLASLRLAVGGDLKPASQKGAQ